MAEQKLEQSLIAKLGDLKYSYRPDITDRATLAQNFREKFEALKTHKKGLMQQLFPSPAEVQE